MHVDDTRNNLYIVALKLEVLPVTYDTHLSPITMRVSLSRVDAVVYIDVQLYQSEQKCFVFLWVESSTESSRQSTYYI